MKSEDTILNQTETKSEETQLFNGQTSVKEQATEQTTGKNSSWKQVAIGGVSGILLGGASVLFTSSSNAENDPNAPQTTAGGGGTPVSPDSSVTVEGLAVATVSDDMPFNEAFAAAREEVGPGGVFEWHGGVYGTYYANEWNAMTPEQQAEFGNRISYGPSTTTANHETNEPAASTTTTSEVHPGAEERPEVLVIEQPENNLGEDEVQIVGVNDAIMEDGSVVTIAQMDIHGEEVFVVDVDHDGTFDMMTVDLNGDGIISANEVCDIQDQGLSVADLQQHMDVQDPNSNFLADNDLPDYMNDADTHGFV